MDQNFSNDDPQLTAYALGGLEGPELAAMEARLVADPAARATVADIRAFEQRMREALAYEATAEFPMAALTQLAAAPVRRSVKPSRRWGKLLEFPQFYFVATGVAAACFLVVFLQPQAERRGAAPRLRTYQEVDLTSSPSSVPNTVEEAAPAGSANTVELQSFSVAKQEASANEKNARLDKDAKEADAEQLTDRRKLAMRASAPAPVIRDETLSRNGPVAEKDKSLAYADFDRSEFQQQRPQSGLATSGFLSETKTAASVENFAKKPPADGASITPPTPVSLADAFRAGLPNEHRFIDAKTFPAAKISWKVATDSWLTVQAALEAGRKPMPESVRIEELLQEFAPKTAVGDRRETFAAKLEVANAPWATNHQLARATLTSGSLSSGNTAPIGGKSAAVARDVKLRVEFNPAVVASYRLIGFENAAVETSGARPDLLNAVVVNPGEAVTALFEIVPVEHPSVVAGLPAKPSDPLLVVKINYRPADRDDAREQEFSLRENETDFSRASSDFKFAAAVAGFGMILRDSPYRGTATFKDVINWAREGIGENESESGSRAHFIDLAKKAEELGQ